MQSIPSLGVLIFKEADKTRSVSVRPQRGMQSIPSLGVLIFKGADKTRSVYMSLAAERGRDAEI